MTTKNGKNLLESRAREESLQLCQAFCLKFLAAAIGFDISFSGTMRYRVPVLAGGCVIRKITQTLNRHRAVRSFRIQAVQRVLFRSTAAAFITDC